MDGEIVLDAAAPLLLGGEGMVIGMSHDVLLSERVGEIVGCSDPLVVTEPDLECGDIEDELTIGALVDFRASGK